MKMSDNKEKNNIPENITELYKVDESNSTAELRSSYMDESFIYLQFDKTTIALSRVGFLDMIEVLNKDIKTKVDKVISEELNKGHKN